MHVRQPSIQGEKHHGLGNEGNNQTESFWSPGTPDDWTEQVLAHCWKIGKTTGHHFQNAHNTLYRMRHVGPIQPPSNQPKRPQREKFSEYAFEKHLCQYKTQTNITACLSTTSGTNSQAYRCKSSQWWNEAELDIIDTRLMSQGKMETIVGMTVKSQPKWPTSLIML